MSLRCLPSNLGSIPITVWEEIAFEEFQDSPHGSHIGCQNGTNLPVLNLHVSPMPPTKFQLNPTYLSRADVVSRFSSWPPWQPSWILEWNQFSNSKSPCHPNASNQGWAQSDLPFGSRHGLKIYKMATMGAILDIRMEWFSNSKSLRCSNASHQVSAQSNLQFGWRCCLKIFKMAELAAILDIGTEWFWQF